MVKDSHFFWVDRWLKCGQAFLMAAKLAQVHDVETTVLDTCYDDVLDFVEIMLNLSAFKLVLVHTDIEAPNADARHLLYPRHIYKLSSIEDGKRAMAKRCTEAIARRSHA